jgi:hypothetical protein
MSTRRIARRLASGVQGEKPCLVAVCALTFVTKVCHLSFPAFASGGGRQRRAVAGSAVDGQRLTGVWVRLGGGGTCRVASPGSSRTTLLLTASLVTKGWVMSSGGAT